MKLFIVLSAISILMISAGDCSKKTSAEVKYKGRLEIAGMCMNYTIKVLQGKMDHSKIAAGWTDETTGKSYTHVFGLKNPCQFPGSIKAGDEFYFYIDTSVNKGCITCLAYYPTPSQKLSILVIEK
jgi:hypothetical protein